MIWVAIVVVSAGALGGLGMYGILELVCADEMRRRK